METTTLVENANPNLKNAKFNNYQEIMGSLHEISIKLNILQFQYFKIDTKLTRK